MKDEMMGKLLDEVTAAVQYVADTKDSWDHVRDKAKRRLRAALVDLIAAVMGDA